MEGAATVITTHGPAAILSRLRGALTSVGDALTLPDLESLVRAEADLASAVADLGRLPSAWSSKEGSEAITAEIAGVAGALRRCRRLGASLDGVVHDVLEAHGRTGAYDRQGAGSTNAPAGAFTVRG
jgi:hypothetical protein